MTQQQLANKIGVHERTIRNWSPRKRKQWQALASKGRDAAWFDLLAQLCFEVDSFNCSSEYEWIWLQVTPAGVELTRFHKLIQNAISHWTCEQNEKLAEALSYVKSLNN